MNTNTAPAPTTDLGDLVQPQVTLAIPMLSLTDEELERMHASAAEIDGDPAWGDLIMAAIEAELDARMDEAEVKAALTALTPVIMAEAERRYGPRPAPAAPGTTSGATIDAGIEEWEPGTPAAPPLPVEEAGVYVMPDGTVVKVQANKDKTRTYAKRWTPSAQDRLMEAGHHEHGEYVYEPGLVALVARVGRKMTLEEAKAHSIRYGQCVRCGQGPAGWQVGGAGDGARVHPLLHGRRHPRAGRLAPVEKPGQVADRLGLSATCPRAVRDFPPREAEDTRMNTTYSPTTYDPADHEAAPLGRYADGSPVQAPPSAYGMTDAEVVAALRAARRGGTAAAARHAAGYYRMCLGHRRDERREARAAAERAPERAAIDAEMRRRNGRRRNERRLAAGKAPIGCLECGGPLPNYGLTSDYCCRGCDDDAFERGLRREARRAGR